MPPRKRQKTARAAAAKLSKKASLCQNSTSTQKTQVELSESDLNTIVSKILPAVTQGVLQTIQDMNILPAQLDVSEHSPGASRPAPNLTSLEKYQILSLNLLIKHRSSGKFFYPEGGQSNPDNDTPIVLHEEVNRKMHWTFEKVTDQWGYIKHVSSGKIIHPQGGSLNPENDTKLLLHSDRHWGALFALDAANGHVIHKGGRYAHPAGGSPSPCNGTTVVLHSDVHDAMRFQFVSTSDHSKEVLVYGKPTVLGKWKIINMVCNPATEHVDKLEIKIGKSTTENRTTSFQYRWEKSAGFNMELVKTSTAKSVRMMLENTSFPTWSSETTKTREIRVVPGKTVVTWQYVFDIQQNNARSVFQSDLLADTDSETNAPGSLQYRA